MQNAYGFEFGRENVVRMDTGLVYAALKDSQVDVGLVFATDGRIPAFDFVVLADDKGFFPSYSLTPGGAQGDARQEPEARRASSTRLSAKLDDATMAKLNATVDVEKKTIEEVSTTFLKSQGLI